MRILYLANYQGADIARERSLVRNRALGASTKIEAIARALAARGHEVHILSPATSAERSARWYARRATQLRAGEASVAIEYLPVWDLPIFNVLGGRLATLLWLRKRHDWEIVLLYNITRETLAAAEYVSAKGVPVVFEYEDDVTGSIERGSATSRTGRRLLRTAQQLGRGAIAVNDDLRAQLGLANVTIVQGIVPDEALAIPVRSFRDGEVLRIFYAGGLTHAKGVDLLLQAVKLLDLPFALVLTGAGPLHSTVASACAGDSRLTFLGEVSRDRLERELARCHVCVNPHKTVPGNSRILFPFKIAEYLAYGAVVVSSTLGPTPNPLTRGIVSYCADAPDDLADAIRYAALHYPTLRRGVEFAREYVTDNLSTRAVGRAIERVLQGAIHSSPLPRA